jgi:hypothetical protein
VLQGVHVLEKLVASIISEESNTDSACSRIDRLGRYLEFRGMNYQHSVDNCTMRNFTMYCCAQIKKDEVV